MRRPPCAASAAARLRRKIVSVQFDEENPFMLISSVLLVQAGEGVSFLVVDRIGDIYRNIPRRADVIVTTVGARHKCQQALLTSSYLPLANFSTADVIISVGNIVAKYDGDIMMSDILLWLTSSNLLKQTIISTVTRSVECT
ncbi:serine/threonine-protein kinase KIPK-like [Dorcoceras hygrometricum]|uniref:Serine/threonine-protein kinase KIPK-like n=1 Tax=Dorcoceras hygrometricum TaxID=472368 RepID=A0A2Z7ASQ1_9LAMI|nr:serine/threonine-protein kinase KIPK-like [Dorcoceras hygrometricum]